MPRTGSRFGAVAPSTSSGSPSRCWTTTRRSRPSSRISSRPWIAGGSCFGIGISVKIAMASGDLRGADHLFEQADTAFYRAKSAGRNTCCVFEAGTEAEVVERVTIEREFRTAIGRSSLGLVYQPDFSITEGRVIGCKALLRWRRADGASVSPAEFIPIMEETGLTVTLGA